MHSSDGIALPGQHNRPFEISVSHLGLHSGTADLADRFGGLLLHHPQFAADGDESPSLRDPLQGRLGIGDMDPGRHTVAQSGGSDRLERGDELRILRFHLGRLMHRCKQIVWPDENGVDPRHAQDFLATFHPLAMFDLDDHQSALIGIAVVGSRVGIKVQRMLAAADAAVPFRGILAGSHGQFRLLAAVAHRENDAIRPLIERPFGVLMRDAGNADQRRPTGVCDGGEHQRGGLPIDGAVLHIDRQPVPTRARLKPCR